jgi:hypothetical protein
MRLATSPDHEGRPTTARAWASTVAALLRKANAVGNEVEAQDQAGHLHVAGGRHSGLSFCALLRRGLAGSAVNRPGQCCPGRRNPAGDCNRPLIYEQRPRGQGPDIREADYLFQTSFPACQRAGLLVRIGNEIADPVDGDSLVGHVKVIGGGAEPAHLEGAAEPDGVAGRNGGAVIVEAIVLTEGPLRSSRSSTTSAGRRIERWARRRMGILPAPVGKRDTSRVPRDAGRRTRVLDITHRGLALREPGDRWRSGRTAVGPWLCVPVFRRVCRFGGRSGIAIVVATLRLVGEGARRSLLCRTMGCAGRTVKWVFDNTLGFHYVGNEHLPTLLSRVRSAALFCPAINPIPASPSTLPRKPGALPDRINGFLHQGCWIFSLPPAQVAYPSSEDSFTLLHPSCWSIGEVRVLTRRGTAVASHGRERRKLPRRHRRNAIGSVAPCLRAGPVAGSAGAALSPSAAALDGISLAGAASARESRARSSP